MSAGNTRYALFENATYFPTSPNEVIVKGGALEGFSLLVEDPERRGLLARLIEELRNTATVDDLQSSVLGDIAGAEISDIVQSLLTSGAIKSIDADQASPEVQWAAFVRFGETPPATSLRQITVLSTDDVAPVIAATRQLGVPVATLAVDDVDWSDFSPAEAVTDGEPTGAPLGEGGEVPVRRDQAPLVYIGTSISPSVELRLNEESVRHGVPLLYVGMDGVDLRLGPYVVPGRTPCMWEVERQWLRASADSAQYESLMRVDRGRTAPTEIAVQGLNAALAPMLLELALRGTSSAVGSVRHVKVTTGTNSSHTVMRLPRCPVCLPMQPLTRNPLY